MIKDKKSTVSEMSTIFQILSFLGATISIFLLNEIRRKLSDSQPLNTQIIKKAHSNLIGKNIATIEDETAKSVESGASLSKFVDDNEKLINVLGIFTAITMFVSELRLQAFGYALSFMFMTLTVILWLELWGKFPSEAGDWKITWFENILSVTVLALLIYWVIDFRDIWHDFLFILIFGVLSAILSIVMKKLNFFNRLLHSQTGRHCRLRYLFGILLIVIIVGISFFVAQWVSPSINEFLDMLNQNIQDVSK